MIIKDRLLQYIFECLLEIQNILNQIGEWKMQLNLKNFPTIAEIRSASDTLNKAMADISGIQTNLEKPTTFLYDTLSGFFDKYEDAKHKDMDTLTFMWYAAQSYRVYIESTLEYILSVSEKLDNVHDLLSSEFNALNGCVEQWQCYSNMGGVTAAFNFHHNSIKITL